MKCSVCGNKIRKKAKQCKHCGAEIPKRQKANKLGNCAIVFAFLFPVLGLLFGIISLIVAPKKQDPMLRNDGIKAIIMSIVVMAVKVLLLYVFAMLGFAAPFIITTIANG